jgi:prepilin-type N-terminal cleavage/methylation domain-containing protein
MQQVRGQAGFTIVELLVTVAIILVLVSISLPVIIKARAEATRLACSTRVGQVMFGTLAFGNDNDDRLPLPNLAGDNGEEFAQGWLYSRDINTEPVFFDRTSGSLWNYIQDDRTYTCGAHLPSNEGTALASSFQMNAAVVAFGRRTRSFFSFNFLPTSAIYWDAQDGNHATGTLGATDTDGATSPAIVPEGRHFGSTNLVLIDGSARPVRRDEFQSLSLQYPGPLWCVPNTRDGR